MLSRTPFAIGLTCLSFAFGCNKTATPDNKTATPDTSSSSRNPCGISPDDWCPSPPGDPCGKHKDVNSCKADKACKGMPYQGESVVACVDDGTGFAANCPTVGCISR